jgi:hypothetical protein
MELFLNLAWSLVAGTLVSLWLRGEGWNQPDRRRHLIALAVLIAVLFPVISVSDDLLAIQNVSEADNYLRRDHLIPSGSHPVQPVLTMMAAIIFTGFAFGFLRFVAPSFIPVKGPHHLDLAWIENRPPPGV